MLAQFILVRSLKLLSLQSQMWMKNPLANFKVLYGTGHLRTNRATGKVERSKGILYTVKDGIDYDTKELLANVRKLVKMEKEKEGKN